MTRLLDLGFAGEMFYSGLTKIPFDDEFWHNFTQCFDELIDALAESSSFTRYSSKVLIDRGAWVSTSANIFGPAIVLAGAEVRSNALLRPYSFIGRNSLVGHATEVSSSVLFDEVHASHKAYLGNSFIGEGSLIGAGAVLSNTRLDRGDVSLFSGKYAKMGSIVGAGSSLGANCVINPGVVLPKNTTVPPLGYR